MIIQKRCGNNGPSNPLLIWIVPLLICSLLFLFFLLRNVNIFVRVSSASSVNYSFSANNSKVPPPYLLLHKIWLPLLYVYVSAKINIFWIWFIIWNTNINLYNCNILILVRLVYSHSHKYMLLIVIIIHLGLVFSFGQELTNNQQTVFLFEEVPLLPPLCAAFTW